MNGHTGILGEQINQNGQKLIDFAESKNLEILNHTRAEGKVTWRSRDFISAIDYILANENSAECISNVLIDEKREIDIDTDHNMTILDFQTKIQNAITKTQCRKKGGKWKITDVSWDEFQVDLAELDILYEGTPDDKNREIVGKINMVAGKYFKKTKSRRKKNVKPWWNKDIEEARNNRRIKNGECRKARKYGRISDDQYIESWNSYQKQQKVTKRKIREAVAKQKKPMVEDIRKKGEENSREWYKFLRGENFSEIETPKSIIVNGITITNEEDITKEKFWRNILDGGDESYEINLTIG